MIHKIDTLWFLALQKFNRWTIRKGQAHCLRQKERRFQRLMKSQNPNLN